MFDLATDSRRYRRERRVTIEELRLGLGSIVALGVGAQWLASRLGVPSILCLLVVGLLVGTVVGLIDPDVLLGDLAYTCSWYEPTSHYLVSGFPQHDLPSGCSQVEKFYLAAYLPGSRDRTFLHQ